MVGQLVLMGMACFSLGGGSRVGVVKAAHRQPPSCGVTVV